MIDTIADTSSPGADLQRVLLGIIAGVQRDIDALPDMASERVHDIRVGMKKFRAVLRLAATVLSKKSRARADKPARALKEHFASTRDSDVLRALLQDLLCSSEASDTAESLGLSAAPQETETVADPVAGEICRSLTDFTEGLKLDALSAEDVGAAWVCTYRDARRAMERCVENKDNDTLFHEWRKRVKELLYQSAILGFIPAAEGVAHHAQDLSSELGSHHDLSLLCGRLANSIPGSHAEEVARLRKNDFARRALVTGAELLATKPSQLHVRL